jgi:hypothetical protein
LAALVLLLQLVDELPLEELLIEGREVELARRLIDQGAALGRRLIAELSEDPVEGALDVRFTEAHRYRSHAGGRPPTSGCVRCRPVPVPLEHLRQGLEARDDEIGWREVFVARGQVGHHGDGHPGGLGRQHAGAGVLDDETALRVGRKAARGHEIPVGGRLAARHLVAGDDRLEHPPETDGLEDGIDDGARRRRDQPEAEAASRKRSRISGTPGSPRPSERTRAMRRWRFFLTRSSVGSSRLKRIRSIRNISGSVDSKNDWLSRSV